jgi:hypothetical protein
MAEPRRKMLRRFGIFWGLILLLFPWANLFSQGRQSKNAIKEDASRSRADFRVSVKVVVLSATVTNKNGKPAEDVGT